MENKFNLGQVVILNSSPGIRMTIKKINVDKTYLCSWLDLKRNIKTGTFDEHELSVFINPVGSHTL